MNMKRSFTKINSVLFTFIMCIGSLSAQESNCLDYRFYYSDAHGSSSDIYEVILGDGVAEMNLLKEVPYDAHIAYNTDEHLLYIVNTSNGSFQKLEVSAPDGIISTPVGLDISISHVINATFNHDNKLLVAAESTDKVYQVTDLDAGSTLEFSDAPVSGGDIAFDNEGNLLMATREGNGKLMRIHSFNPVTLEYPVNIQIGTVPALVTGIAKTEDGNMLLSAKNANAFVVYAADGSGPIEAESYATPFTLSNGDMASGCAQSAPVIEGCQNFKYYYIADNTPGYAQGTVFGGAIVNGEFALTELFASGISAHLAVNNENGDLYVVNGSVLRTYNESGDQLNSVSTSGLGSIVAAVWNPADGLVYAGSANQHKIYKINPVSGASELVASQVPVHGGDLILDDEGNLLLIERNDNTSSKLYVIAGGTATLINGDLTTAINGAAMTQMGGLIAAKGNHTNSFYLYDIDGYNGVAIDAVIDGEPFPVVDGDMASGCFGNQPVIIPGQCYATEVIEYIEGTSKTGGNIALNRTDASQATSEPERTDANVFVSLGYDGSLTLAFDGAVPNMEGDDIEVVETSFGHPSCSSYPEFADVYVSQNGVDFFFARTICRTDGFVDISDAGDFDYITEVRIVNNNELSTTPDGFDVDGVVALHNCDELEQGLQEAVIVSDESEGISAEVNTADMASKLSTYPNPTTGPTTIQFVPAQSGNTNLVVMDMNGKIVKTLFDANAVSGETYNIDFNVVSLPNGIYITKLTTNSESIINKIIIDK